MVVIIPSLYNEFQVVSINLHKLYILFIFLGGYYIYIVHVEWFKFNLDGETNRENIVLIH